MLEGTGAHPLIPEEYWRRWCLSGYRLSGDILRPFLSFFPPVSYGVWVGISWSIFQHFKFSCFFFYRDKL